VAKSYRDLIAWQKAIALVTEIYRITRQFPKEEIYGLTSQIRRAAVSVPSNIAEGQARLSKLEFKNFLSHARSSLVEIETQLLIARNLNYLPEPAADRLLKQVTEVARILNGLLNTVRTSSENRELRTEN
jgi:four helix bundle protein